MSAFDELRKKFRAHTAEIAVVGQGYVGLPLIFEFVKAGFECIGIDVDENHVARLRDGHSDITDIDDDTLQQTLASGRYRVTTDYSEAASADAVFICVPTPLSKTREPDLTFVQSAAESLRPHLSPPCLVVLESTTFPGTTDEILTPLLLGDEFELDEDLLVAFSPERVDPANPDWNIQNTPKIVGGVTDDSGDAVEELYSQVIESIHRMENTRESEMVKLLENTFRAVNIALVNEMAIMCDRMDVDIWQVIEAAATKPFGFMPFYPGPGIGGHCIPLDPTFLSWKAKRHGFYNRFIELANDLNTNMPRFVVQKLTRLLNDRGTPLNGANILLAGMAYKPDVNDLRQSPALDIWKLLEERGAELQYHDPLVPKIDQLGGVTSSSLHASLLEDLDALVITTDHSSIDYAKIVEHTPLIFDTRNAIPEGPAHLVRL